MQQMAERAGIEQRLRQEELDKEMQMVKVEEQRRLRQFEEEEAIRNQRMLEEMRMRQEENFRAEQDRQNRYAYEDNERKRANDKMTSLEEERKRIETLLARER